jgi:hypothetical protein
VPTSDTEFVFAKLISIPGIDFQLADSYDDPIIYTSSSGYKRWQINFSESIPRFQNSFTNTGSVCMGPGGGGVHIKSFLDIFLSNFFILEIGI